MKIFIIGLWLCLGNLCNWLYSFDNSINFPISTVFYLETFGESCPSVSYPIPHWSTRKDAKTGERLEAFSTQGKTGCMSWQWLPQETQPKGLMFWTVANPCLLLCQGLGKGNHHQSLSRGDSSVVMCLRQFCFTSEFPTSLLILALSLPKLFQFGQ